mgnify:FL=1
MPSTPNPHQPNLGTTVLSWWSTHLAADRSDARALSARLRRATAPSQVLSEAAVHVLLTRLRSEARLGEAVLRDPVRIYRLVTVLAHVMTHTPKTPLFALAGRRASRGPDRLVLSHLRFQKVLMARPEELATTLRRVLAMTEGRANVAALARDLIFFDDSTRQRWCFDYFQSSAAIPQTPSKEETSA